MSLVGNLEDLGLGEILQIVSLSRKSGVLQLNSRGRDGQVVFRDGQVIRAMSSVLPENLGDLVLRAGLADIKTLKKALVVQQENDDDRRIGDILVDEFGVDRGAIETVVREQLEKVVYSFFGWEEGAFSFELGESEELEMTPLDPLQFLCEQGLNPQWLAMEGSRLLDEKRHRGEDLEERGESIVDAEALLAEVKGDAATATGEVTESPAAAMTDPNAAAPTLSRTVLVIDDDPNIVEQLAALLQERRARVRAFTSEQSFLAAVEEADPAATTLLIDLVMPSRHGCGMLGGLDLLEQVRQTCPGFQVLVMTDHTDQAAEKSVTRFGVRSLLTKPTRARLQAKDGQDLLEALIDAVLTAETACPKPVPVGDGLYNIAAELLEEIGEVTSSSTSQSPQQSPGLHLLRGMLQELNNPSLGGGIILLILRFASELMNRAVILLVKEEEIVGLGQFGIELPSASADVRVRNTRLPKNESHVFAEALQSFSPYHSEPAVTDWNDYLFEQLGGDHPAEVFIGPLISEGRVVAVLYGDNLPEQKPIGETEALEIFLSQAGLAMEKALLERRATRNLNTV